MESVKDRSLSDKGIASYVRRTIETGLADAAFDEHGSEKWAATLWTHLEVWKVTHTHALVAD